MEQKTVQRGRAHPLANRDVLLLGQNIDQLTLSNETNSTEFAPDSPACPESAYQRSLAFQHVCSRIAP